MDEFVRTPLASSFHVLIYEKYIWMMFCIYCARNDHYFYDELKNLCFNLKLEVIPTIYNLY